MYKDRYQEIYATRAEEYHAMVSCEDYEGNLLKALQEICPLEGLNVIEMGAGTGRITRQLTPLVRSIHAHDLSEHMLQTAQKTMTELNLTNWSLSPADNRAMPHADAVADFAVAGWSFSSGLGWFYENWQREVGKMVSEMLRVLKPGGIAVIIETMGTGYEQPTIPTERLEAYYHWLENEHDFEYRWIRTDYKFTSIKEADALTRFFFGDELADRIVREQMTILPECTGLWYKQKD